MTKRPDHIIEKLKPEHRERLKLLMTDSSDWKSFCDISDVHPVNSIRVNTLKISIEELKKRLKTKWKIKQPFKENPEIIIIESKLIPGELGKAREHLLGYYYIQEISSMMPIIALNPKEEELFIDLCAAPGSKTTQAVAYMKNRGTVIANDASMGRISILSTNIQRCGVTNTVITKTPGELLCKKLSELKINPDKILVDAPCSGEGTIRSSIQSTKMFSNNLIRKLSKIQKALVKFAIEVLKIDGELVYSTCTHAPEENEEIVSYILENYPEMEIQKINLPIKTRPGIKEWQGRKFHPDVIKSERIYPQDNDTEGFFIAKFRKVEK